MVTRFKKQYRFPLLKKFEEHFPFIKGNKNVVFAYNGVIYSNTKLPDHLLVHEEHHLEQQVKAENLDEWIEQYIHDAGFRLRIEAEAYQKQLDFIKDPKFKAYVKEKAVEDLSSALYEHLITKEDAEKLLK